MPRPWLLLSPLFIALVSPANVANAQDPPTTRPHLLDQLNRETQSLYRSVRRGALRVQLPPPRWLELAADLDNPLHKYKQLDPKVREQLQLRAARRTARAEGEPVARANVAEPATQTVTRTASDADVRVPAGAAMIVVPPPADATESVGAAPPAFAPNNLALVLDEQGHVLVPVYLEPEAAKDQPLRVGAPDGKVIDAAYVGADKQTNITVLKLTSPTGVPVPLGVEDRPADGALVLLVAPLDGAARLAVWTGGARDDGVVFTTDGRCAGVARFGQFLSGRACRLIGEQIIRHGSVRRATLGVIITVLPKDDPAVPTALAAGARSAMRIDQVISGSAAEGAGIRVGDLVLSLAGQPISDIPTLAAAIAAREGPTDIQLLRGGKPLRVTVDLRPK